jgi:hypothetical protein
MEKDRRYLILKKLIVSGQVNSVKDILEVLPKTTLSRDMGMHHITFEKYLNDPFNFTYGDTKKIAQLIEVEHEDIFRIMLNECQAKDASTKKSKGRSKKF